MPTKLIMTHGRKKKKKEISFGTHKKKSWMDNGLIITYLT